MRKPTPPSPSCTAPSAWFAERGVTVERVLSDNGSAYRPTPGATPAPNSSVTHKRTRPYRPTDQRQDRTLPPHPVRRLGLRPPLRLRNRPPRRPASLAALLQSPPSPQRYRRPTADQPPEQPAWAASRACRARPATRCTNRGRRRHRRRCPRRPAVAVRSVNVATRACSSQPFLSARSVSTRRSQPNTSVTITTIIIASPANHMIAPPVRVSDSGSTDTRGSAASSRPACPAAGRSR